MCGSMNEKRLHGSNLEPSIGLVPVPWRSKACSVEADSNVVLQKKFHMPFCRSYGSCPRVVVVRIVALQTRGKLEVDQAVLEELQLLR